MDAHPLPPLVSGVDAASEYLPRTGLLLSALLLQRPRVVVGETRSVVVWLHLLVVVGGIIHATTFWRPRIAPQGVVETMYFPIAHAAAAVVATASGVERVVVVKILKLPKKMMVEGEAKDFVGDEHNPSASRNQLNFLDVNCHLLMVAQVPVEQLQVR